MQEYRNLVTFKTIRKCAKALYLVGGLLQMDVYLSGLCEDGQITEEEEYSITEDISRECASITVGELEELRKKF